MAISTQKFLPQAKTSAIVKSKENFLIPFNKLKVKTTKTSKTSKDSVSKDNKISKGLGDYKTDLIDINKILIKIDKLLKSSFATNKKAQESKRRRKENVEFKAKEDELEKEKPKGFKGPKLPKAGGGFLSGIINGFMRFIFFVALGWIIPKLMPLLPALMGVFKVIGTIYKVVEDIFGWVLDGLVSFIDLGFTIQDQFRGAIKAIGGEGAAKVFDNFNGALSTLINTIVITGMLFSSGIFDIIGQFRKKGKKDCGPGFGAEDLLPDGERKPKGKPGEKPKITGDTPETPLKKRGPFSGIRDKYDELKKKFQPKPKITGDAPKSPLDRIKRAIDERNPFKQKPKITGDTPGGKGFFTGIGEGFGKAFKWIEGLGKGASEVYKKTVGALRTSADDLLKKGKGVVWKWLSEQPGVLGKVAKAAPDLLKRLGKYLPFVGDLVGFVMDIMNGIDWRRALIRTLTGIGIDAGFTALMGALGLATPFTGGASGVLATAIYLAYMSADFASGGFGVLLGDKIADFLKLPMKAGEKGDAPPPGKVGSESDVKKVQADIEKKKKEDPEFAARISGQKQKPPGQQPTQQQKPQEGKTQGAAIGGLIGPKQEETVDTGLSAETRGGKAVGGELTRGGKGIGGVVKRTLRIQKKKPQKPQKPLQKKKEEVKPGLDLRNGEESIIKLFNGSKIDDGKKNGFSTLIKASNIAKDIPFGIGTLMGSVVDVVLGQKPLGDVTSELSESISYLLKISGLGLSLKDEINNMFSFETGGMVPPMASLPFMKEINPDLLSKSLSPLVDQKLEEIFQLVQSETGKGDRSKTNTKDQTQTKQDKDQTDPAADANPGPVAPPVTGKKADLWKQFKGYGATAGAKYPQLVSAQFALESGWGTALSGTHNYFGIKAAPGESATQHNTREVYNGKSVYIKAGFKNFNSPQDAVNHLVTQWYKDYKGYKGVNNAQSAEDAAKMLKEQKYATDPGYSSSLIRLLKENASLSAGGAFRMMMSMFGKKKKNKGQWVSGSMSGYPATMEGDSMPSFFGHGLEWAGFNNNRDSGYVVPFNTPKTEKDPGLTEKRFNEAKMQGYSLPKMDDLTSNFFEGQFGKISDEMVQWAKANRKMIEKVGTKKQKAILAQVDMQENLQKLWKVNTEKEKKNAPKMIGGGCIGNNKPSTPSINNFTLDNNPYKKGGVFVQPIIQYQTQPVQPVSRALGKTMGFPYNKLTSTEGLGMSDRRSNSTLTLTTM